MLASGFSTELLQLAIKEWDKLEETPQIETYDKLRGEVNALVEALWSLSPEAVSGQLLQIVTKYREMELSLKPLEGFEKHPGLVEDLKRRQQEFNKRLEEELPYTPKQSGMVDQYTQPQNIKESRFSRQKPFLVLSQVLTRRLVKMLGVNETQFQELAKQFDVRWERLSQDQKKKTLAADPAFTQLYREYTAQRNKALTEVPAPTPLTTGPAVTAWHRPFRLQL